MCGIFGAIATPGKKINVGIIRALAIANRDRGTDSLGFFDSTGKMMKRSGDPSKGLSDKAVTKWLNQACEKSWFVAGHTRHATRGKVNRRNSHPFRYGRIIGSHNGMVAAPNKFEVDSEYIFYLLNKARGNYNKALADLGGYWGLSWFDGSEFWLMVHNGELSVTEIDGVFYYSSSARHLEPCTGGKAHTFGEGEVWRFNLKGMVGTSLAEGSPVKAFVSTCKDKWFGNYGNYGYGSYYGRNHTTGGRGGPGKKASKDWRSEQADLFDVREEDVRDYDREWAEAWASYIDEDGSSSVHSMSDEDFERYAG